MQRWFPLLTATALTLHCAAGGSDPKRQPDTEPSTTPTPTTPPVIIDIGGSPGNVTIGGAVAPTCTEACLDFPESPVFDTQAAMVSPNAAELFGDATNRTPGAFCVLEPQLSEGERPGALVPANWLRPRFRFEAPPELDLFEIRLSAEKQVHDLVLYTTARSWSVPKEIWAAAAPNLAGELVTVTIRGVSRAQPAVPQGVTGSFRLAPVNAGGSMVYWATTSSEVLPTTSKLVGFRVGDEGVVDALTIPQVAQSGILNEGGNALRGKYDNARGVPPGHTQCIGCHVSTPDGEAVGFTDHWPWNNVLSSVKDGSPGVTPAYVTKGAQALLGQPWLGMMTFSPAHWAQGNRIALTTWGPRPNGAVGFSGQSPYPSGSDGLAWFDLETPAVIPWEENQVTATNEAIARELGRSFGFLSLLGETRSVVAPDFSNDGTRVVYTSAQYTQDGRIGQGQPTNETDIHLVPYNNRQGGEVTPIAGASTPGIAEYYASFSSDDKLLAFNRAPSTEGLTYYRPDGEVWVLPSEGGTPVRLLANDPPACSGETSPGVINSWAKWSPRVAQTNGRTYYFLIFSSARKYEGAFIVPKHPMGYSPPDTRSSQLYMAAVVRDDATGELETYPAVYLWNQDPSTSNLTPAWDEFLIPEVVVR